jgi:hypothetical protein
LLPARCDRYSPISFFYLTDDLGRLHDHFLRQRLKLITREQVRLKGFLLGFFLKFGAAQRFGEG